MSNRDILILVGIGALAYLYFSNQKAKSSSSVATKASANTLPPLPKQMIQQQEEIVIMDVEPSHYDGYDKFNINVVDPKFGYDFFQHGVSLC
jgi:hypothetical protein